MTELATLDIERRGGTVIARVAGELDISNAAFTGEAISAAIGSDVRGLVVDFSELEFLDSSGVSMLFGLARELSEHRQRMRVVAAEGTAVARVLDIVDFGRAAPVDAALEDAVSGVDSPQA